MHWVPQITTAGISLAQPGERKSKGIVLTGYYPLETGLERITFLCVGVLTNEIKQYLIFFFIAILEVKEVNNHFICQILGKNWTRGANWGQFVIDFLVFLILKEDKGCLKV